MNRDVFTFDVNEQLRKIRANTDQYKISTISSDACELSKKISTQSCDEISNISRISSPSAVNPNFFDKDNVEEIKKLIRSYARYWDETEENIEEYISDQLTAFLWDDLINCFRSLNADIQDLKCPSAIVANIAKSMEK